MAKKLIINQAKVNDASVEAVMKVCPFGGLEFIDGKLNFTAGCKSCGLCVKKGPVGLVTEEIVQDDTPKIDKSKWIGVSVFIEVDIDGIHPVSFELIGKAKELANVCKHPVYAILIGSKEKNSAYASQILEYGVDKVYIYEDETFATFNMERYARCVEDFIERVQPSVVLYGGTSLGRSFAPRIAAHFRTGLTADCTMLGMKENSDLIQVRPAFGGNVMAQIICPNHRPQMSTVRYKIFKMPEKVTPFGKKVYMDVTKINKESAITTLEVKNKERVTDISEADVIVACGRAFKTVEDLQMAEELASLLGGVVAVTRPLVEAGWKDAKFQIGLSGRTVAPKLIITLGISGAVQFTAGMTGSEMIVSVNQDSNASIFDVSHYGIIGDIYKVVPELISNIKNGKGLL